MSRLRIVRFAVVLFLLANNASAIVIGKPVEADHLPVSNTQTSNNSTDGFIAPPGTIPPSVTQDAISPSLLQDTGRVPPMALEMLAGNAVPQASTANLQLVGQISGATFAVAVQGNYAYIGVGPRLVVLNISNKASPVMVGQTNILPGFVEDVAVAGNYAYIADGSGLRVVNVANPNAPTEVGFIDTPGYAQSVTVSGNNAYIADQGSGLRIIDVARPDSPTAVGFYDTPGIARDVAVRDSYAYVADWNAGLRIINVANPTAPTEVGFYNSSRRAEGVVVVGVYAYLAENTWEGNTYIGTLRIVNIANPTAPIGVGSYNTYRAHSVAISGDYAYVADDVYGLRIINIANPAAPYLASTFHTSVAAGVASAGTYVFVADVSSLRIVNVANPAFPSQASFFPTSGYAEGVAVAGSYSYLGGYPSGLHIFSVANPAAITQVGYSSGPYGAGPMQVSGNYAYIADAWDGLSIINIANAAAPIEIGSYNTPGYAWDVALAGNYAYVADYHDGGLRVINVANPSAPVEVGSLDTPGVAYGVAVSGTYAYVADATALRVINVANPATPSEVGYCNTAGTAFKVALAGNYAYVVSLSDGLYVVDVANPTTPTLVGFYALPGGARGITVVGDYAYVAGSGLHIIKVTAPTCPIEIGFHDTPGHARDVSVVGSYVYIADFTGGLVILRFTGETQLASQVTSLVTSSCQRTQEISRSALDVSTVGDHFLDKLDSDKAQRVINLGFNSLALLMTGVNWTRIGRGLNHIATPGYEASLHASWRGWIDGRVSKHWYKPLYDSVHNNRRLLFNETALAGLKYYAREAGVETSGEAIKNWMVSVFVPNPETTPVRDYMGSRAWLLGDSYQSEFLREHAELLTGLATLSFSPEQLAAYQADLLARQQANAQIATRLKDHRELLWHSYQKAVADESSWLRFWGRLLLKWGVIGGATLFWDGPGFYVASVGTAAFETIYDWVKDTRNLSHDQKMLDQCLLFLEGRTSLAYAQIALNTVGALNLIRSGDPPQIAGGDASITAMKSLGHYRIWPYLFWAEEGSQMEFTIANVTSTSTTYLTSAAYNHTGFWMGTERLLPEGQALELAGQTQGAGVIKFKAQGWGESPDQGSIVDLIVLGHTDTGIYPVANLQASWYPTPVEQTSGRSAQAPTGYSKLDAAEAPTLPFPLSSTITNVPDTMDYQVTIGVINPFTLTVSATITQAIPGNFVILDADGAQVAGNTLIWSKSLEPADGIELHPLLRWAGTLGGSTSVLAPVLTFRDPNTGLGDTYTGFPETVSAAWPLVAASSVPSGWRVGSSVTIPITLTNVSSGVVQGVLTGNVTTADSILLWSSTQEVSIAAGESQVILLEIRAPTTAGFAVVSGEVTLGTSRREMLLEIVEIRGSLVYLPLIQR